MPAHPVCRVLEWRRDGSIAEREVSSVKNTERAPLRIDGVMAYRNQSLRAGVEVFGCASVLLVLGLWLDACRAEPKLTQQQIEGKRLYQVRCAHCHDENDLALKKIPPDLHGVFKTAKLPSGAQVTDAEVRRVVLAGKGMMPAFTGRFDEGQMSALLAYLHTGLR